MFSNKKFIAVLVVALFFISNQAMALVSGQLIWERHYALDNAKSFPKKIFIDKNNNIYVAGKAKNSMVTIKYDANGNRRWARRYFVDNKEAEAIGIVVDNDGNVFVVGNVNNEYFDNRFILLLKYSVAGKLQWFRRYGSASREGTAASIALDSIGNVYVAGSTSTEEGNDMTAIKYDTNGSKIWEKHYTGSSSSEEDAVKVLIDPDDNIYIAGTSSKIIKNNPVTEYRIIKYDSFGNLKWLKKPELGNFSENIEIADFELDYNKDLFFGIASETGIIILKLSSRGTKLWEKRVKGTNAPVDVAVDKNGNLIIAGIYFSEVFIEMDYVTIKYDTNGNKRWARKFSGNKTDLSKGYISFDYSAGVAVGNNNTIFVTGTGSKSFFDNDIATVKYDSTGQQGWVRRYKGSQNIIDEAVSIAADSTGSIFVTGTSNKDYSETKGDIMLLKYAP